MDFIYTSSFSQRIKHVCVWVDAVCVYWLYHHASHVSSINYWAFASGVSSGAQPHVLVPYTSRLIIPLSSLSFTLHVPFIRFSHFLSSVRLCGCTLSCFPLFLSVPFARCDIALIEQKHVERSDISRGIRGKAGSLCDWQPVFGARGLLGMNVVSVTPDPASCWRGSRPRGVQQNAFVNLIQGSLWTVGRGKAGSSDLWNAELFIPMLWKQRWALELARLL